MADIIRYKGGYQYQLCYDYTHFVGIPGRVNTRFLVLLEGDLLIRAGYAWDGPSGPTVDTPSFMRGSLVHDALYQLIREGHLSSYHRAAADEILIDVCRVDGMPWWRRAYVWVAVRCFGRCYSTANKEPVLTAP